MVKTRNLFIISLFLLIASAGNTLHAQERNLLIGRYSESELKKSLAQTASWVPFPAYSDRSAWSKLFTPIRETVMEEGNQFLDYQWQVVKATDYLAYERNGSRTIMEKPMNENATALSRLFFAELAEGKGRYLDQIINGVWYFTEMSTWSLSAHVPAFQSSKRTLPQEGTQVVDLMAGDMGSMLSWVYYFLKPEMDEVNPEISRRLKTHIQQRIISPYLNRNDMWWLGFQPKDVRLVNNWNPWCNFNVLTCLLLVEDRPERQLAGIYKTMRSVDKFINYVKADGACEEGPSYWGHAAGKLCDYLQLLSTATHHQIDIFDQVLIRDMGEYIAQSYIGGDNWVVNFADASAMGGGNPYLIYRYGEAVGSNEMKQFAKYLLAKNKEPFKASRDVFRDLEGLQVMAEIDHSSASLPNNPYQWYPETEVLFLKQDGDFFAAKGGHNNESHNHNDIGSFIFYREKQPVFIDAGVGTYNKKTFSSERYDIWTMQSAYHNLPQINGIDQQFGATYRSRNISFASKSKRFELDIAGAYPTSAGVKNWQRSYQLKGKELLIKDSFEIEKPTKANIIHFLLAKKPQIERGSIRLNDGLCTLTYDATQFDATVETITQDDPRLSNVWGNTIYRLSLTAKKITSKGQYKFLVK